MLFREQVYLQEVLEHFYLGLLTFFGEKFFDFTNIVVFNNVVNVVGI